MDQLNDKSVGDVALTVGFPKRATHDVAKGNFKLPPPKADCSPSRVWNGKNFQHLMDGSEIERGSEGTT